MDAACWCRSPIRQPLAREICALLADEPRRHAMRKRAYMLGREMIWSNVAHLYMDTFQQARRSLVDQPGRRLRRARRSRSGPLDLPELRLDHLLNMTDSTGIFQHANITIPKFEHGYCTDDNARALILTVLLEELGNESPPVLRAATTYAAFCQRRVRRRARPLPQFHDHRSSLD